MITGVILAHNEEHHIVECIEALRPHVGELFLIDTESTDKTVALARPLVDRILSHPNIPNFDAIRNIAIPRAHFDWLWFVDADERIPIRTGQIVNELISTRGHEFEAINIPFKSHFCGQWMQHCGWWPGYKACSVLKRGHFEFGRILHSGVTLHGREMRFPPDPDLAVPHYSFRDLEHYVTKFNRYTTTEALQLKQKDFKYDWRFAVQMMIHDLWEYYELNDAKLDGSLGWILSWMAGQYRWMSHSKLIDLQARDATPSVPASLDEFLLAMEQELAVLRSRRPELPLGIVLRQTVPATQQSDDMAIVARVLSGGERELAIEAKCPEALLECAEGDRGLLRSLCRARRPKYSVGIVCDPPAMATTSRFDAVKILCTSWPSNADEIPGEWIERARQFDEVWVNSVAAGTALRKRWFPPERIRVIEIQSVEHPAIRQAIEQALSNLENRLQPPAAPDVGDWQVQVEVEGEIFAGHSFSNVNEHLLSEINKESSIALALRRVVHNPTADWLAPRASELLSLTERNLTGAPAITIRHAFPPNWTAPESGLWVHIQPWEYGFLRLDWLPHLRDKVDEIWAPSNYVKRVYVQSGISPDKIHVIPWGVDESTFNPDAPQLVLPTDKSFRFLFVGGTILRKGFDRLLEAYVQEFKRDDDVCLVVKDTGVNSFYKHSNCREQILSAIKDHDNPQILYIDEEFTAGQLASLYCACQCLVAPYRGEGFGLPVLEAMACGIAPIVPRGGPTDDFVSDEVAYVLDAQEIQTGMEGLCGPGTEFDVSMEELRHSLRAAMANRDHTRTLGAKASDSVRGRLTWAQTAERMVSRIHSLVNPHSTASAGLWSKGNRSHLAAIVLPTGDDLQLANCISCLQPFVARVLVVDHGITPRSKSIVQEYGAELLTGQTRFPFPQGSFEWMFCVSANESLDESELTKLQRLTLSLLPTVEVVKVLVRSSKAEVFSRSEERLFRHRPGVIGIDDFCARCRGLGRLYSSGDQPATSDIVIDSVEPVEGAPANFKGSDAMQDGRLNGGSASYDPFLKKGILIQLATGPHRVLLELTRAHHRAYAERYGLDYWCVEGNPAAPKRAGWGKVPLILSAMQMGFERIIWIDADAVIVNPHVDLSKVVDEGIGMVQHPNPTHWNSGVMVICRSEQSKRFFEAVHAQPENDSSWMEQLPINQFAENAEFANLLRSIEPAFNSTPGAIVVPAPVILAAHGLPLSTRRELIAQWVHGAQVGRLDSAGSPEVRTREDFGEFLNVRGLVGEAAEIGVQRGEFSKSFLDRWKGGTLHLIDPWRHLEGYDDVSNLSNSDHEACLRVLENNLAGHQGRYRVHRQLSAEAVGSFADASLDFVFIDANHEFSAVLEDIRAWFPKVKAGGVLAGHDYLDGHLPEGMFGVKSAVAQFEAETGMRAQSTIERSWPSWFFLKPDLLLSPEEADDRSSTCQSALELGQ